MSRPEARPIARSGPLARRGPAAALAALALLTAAPAAAHDRATSRSSWTRTDEGAEVRVRLRALDVSLLRAAGVGDLDAYLMERLTLEDTAGRRCAPGAIEPAPAGRAFLARRWTLRCEGAPAAVRSALLLEAPTHLHVAALPGGRSALLDRSHPRAAFASAAPASVLPHLGRAVLHGARHILSGPDHLLFLALLLVFATRLRELAGVVTGFTLGHSATLVAAALGVELAQLALVFLAWPLLQAWRQRATRPDPLLRWTGAAGVAAGVFWTLTRSLG